MDRSIAKDARSFKEIEEEVYGFVCKIGQKVIEKILINEDLSYHEEIKHLYRNKGYGITTIKTKMGDVTYRRHKYVVVNENGENSVIMPLDEKIGIGWKGLYSESIRTSIIDLVSKVSFREAAKIISETTNEYMSAQAVWNIVQDVGENIQRKEDKQVKDMDEDKLKPQKEVELLYEEEDGVWLKMQDKEHKKKKSQELKLGTIYEGVEKNKGKNRLVGKKVYAGLEDSEKFHERKESQIESIYKIEKIKTRILNGDGASWIRESCDGTKKIYQLDRFHIMQAINRGLNEDEVAKSTAKKLLRKTDIDGLLRYIQDYANSVDTGQEFDKRNTKAKDLYTYLNNNKDALIPYYKRGLKLPKMKDGLKYARMGVQENQNCTVITMRMCSGRKRWSENGANNLAKILYTKENNELEFKEIENVRTITTNVKSTAKEVIKKVKTDNYQDLINVHLPLRDAVRTPMLNAFIDACF